MYFSRVFTVYSFRVEGRVHVTPYTRRTNQTHQDTSTSSTEENPKINTRWRSSSSAHAETFPRSWATTRNVPRTDRSSLKFENLASRGERPAGRAQLLAKRGSIGQMQISAELVPIPDASRIRQDASGCVGILNSSKFRRILAKFRKNLVKI